MRTKTTGRLASMARKSSVGLTVVVLGTLLLSSCGSAAQGPGGASGSPTASDATSSPGSGSPADSASPGSSQSPGSSATPAAGASGSPSGTPESTPGASSSGTPVATTSPVTCTEVTPVRIEELDAQPRRTTEVISVVSDGNRVTSGTRDQTNFQDPELEAPDGTSFTDEATMKKIAALLGAGKTKVLLSRPASPDEKIDPNKRPFNGPGTFVLYSASSPLSAQVIVACGGQEQRWIFRAEADGATGQVNCAVEPPKSNALALQVFQSNC